MRGSFDASLEDPWPDRSPDGYRVTHNMLRYHQIGVASGWVEVDGSRTEITPEKWISIRDHSWGLRPGVGKPIPGLPRGGRKIKQMFMTWLPMTLTRADGSGYSLFVMYQEERGDGFTRDTLPGRATERLTALRTGSPRWSRTCTSKTTTADSPTERSP